MIILAKSQREIDEEDYDADGFVEALKVALSKPQVLESILIGAKAWAVNRPEEMKLRFRALHLSIAFALVLFIGIGVMAYVGVLNREVTAGMLGTLIGYWYGQSKK